MLSAMTDWLICLKQTELDYAAAGVGWEKIEDYLQHKVSSTVVWMKTKLGDKAGEYRCCIKQLFLLESNYNLISLVLCFTVLGEAL